MSRFGNSGTFYYAPGDALTSATMIVLDEGQLPQYPFTSITVTDRVNYRSKSGKAWSYENYNLESFGFTFVLMDEPKARELRAMYDAKPIISFVSGGHTFGTFRFADTSWKDQETAFELYDISFTLEETT